MAAAMIATAQVKTGVEVLRDGGFKELQGKRVGLVTNPSGVDRNLKSTVDILNEAEGVKLVALWPRTRRAWQCTRWRRSGRRSGCKNRRKDLLTLRQDPQAIS